MSTKKVLLVDDDQSIHQLFAICMQQAGYDMVSAFDGMSSIGIARREAPDLIILDLGLPAGDGEGALRSLRGMQQFSSTPVIVASARAESEWAEYVRALGASAYLEKPVDPSNLMQVVRRMLGDEVAPAPSQASAPPQGPPEPAAEPVAPLPVADSRNADAAGEGPGLMPLSCPHCGELLASLQATFSGEAVGALLDALRQRS